MGPFTLTRAVADLEQVRQALDGECRGVLGRPWGAGLALRCAAARSQGTTVRAPRCAQA